MTKKEFMIQYVLKRARGFGSDIPGMMDYFAREAEKNWECINVEGEKENNNKLKEESNKKEGYYLGHIRHMDSFIEKIFHIVTQCLQDLDDCEKYNNDTEICMMKKSFEYYKNTGVLEIPEFEI